MSDKKSALKRKTKGKQGLTSFAMKSSPSESISDANSKAGKKGYATKAERSKTFKEIKEEVKAEVVEELKAEAREIPLAPSGLVEIGGVEKERHDANILRLEWSIKYPLLTPLEFLLEEKGYTIYQAQRILEISDSIEGWLDERDKIVNGVTEKLVDRNIEKIVESKEMFISAAKIGVAKCIEMMTRLQIDPVKDEDGKLMIDPKTKRPVYRGFRAIDMANLSAALKNFESMMSNAMGMRNDLGLDQIRGLLSEHRQNVQINIQNNSTTVMTTEEPKKTKVEEFVESLSYDDMQEIIREKRRMRNAGEIVDAEVVEKEGE